MKKNDDQQTIKPINEKALPPGIGMRCADVSAGFGFGFGCECFFRTFFSPLFLLAMGAIFRSCLLSPIWSMELVSLHEMDTLPSWSYLDFLPFLDLRACRLPAILTELALLNWVNRLFSPLIRYAISFWCVKPGAKSYLRPLLVKGTLSRI